MERYTKRNLLPEDTADAIRRYWRTMDGATPAVSREEIREHLDEILDGLTDRQREALVRRADKHETLRESADGMGVSTERVRQLYLQALRKAQAEAESIIKNGKYIPEEAPIEMLGLSYSKCRRLHSWNISTVGQLASMKASELALVRSIGDTMAQYLLDISKDFIEQNSRGTHKS